MHMTLKGAAAALATFALAGAAAAQPAQNPYVNDKPVFSASLGLGGTGSFTGVFDPQASELCYILNAGAIDRPGAVHVHAGKPGEGAAGSPLLTLETPENGSSGGCIPMEARVAQAILADPAGHYLDIHSAAYPDGEVRVPLTAQRPTAAAAAAAG